MSEMDEVNRQVIDEFRANDGAVEAAAGGFFADKPLLLLHTTGARTGAEYVKPLMYRDEGAVRFIFASNNAGARNPGWYHNIKANPDVTVEMATETYAARASEVSGADRDRIYAGMAEALPQFAEYEKKTSRTIPVVALERTG